MQHLGAKQSEPPGSGVQGNTSDSGVSELPTSEIEIGKRKGRARKEGGRGKKQPWTKRERCVLWECYIRSGGREVKGYRDRGIEMWNGRDLSVRTESSVLTQLNEILKGGKLSVFEMRKSKRR